MFAYVRRFAACLFIAVCSAAVAHAQATRTWVSGVGDDANPCSRTAPCKTFAGAISKTAAKGVINALDPAGYGAVTITKSITIEADGVVASILTAGTNGVVVNAAASDVVTLRGLKFVEVSGSTAANAVRFLNGGTLIVENAEIDNFHGSGIDMVPSSNPATLVVRDTLVRGCGDAVAGGAGIAIQPAGNASVNATLERVQLVANNADGLLVSGTAAVAVRDGVASENGGNGFSAYEEALPVSLVLNGVLAAHNHAFGVFAYGAGSTVRLSNSTTTGNAVGIKPAKNGRVLSFGNNRNSGNTTDGAPSSTVPLQ
ncbi:MAG TPA: right-handed parallel beta-helix repeat-containing protein [Dokdonella sp.]|nr:right-handed parallel beta-helix repeat-containing protein [Dokdonella sp.]